MSSSSARSARAPIVWVLYGAATLSLVLFIMLNLSDWPAGFLSGFWRDHPIVGASLGTVLLIAVGYFAFDSHDRRLQKQLDDNVAATARSGLVDYLVDIDVALSLLAADRSVINRMWPEWAGAGKPLRWLRLKRESTLTTRDFQPSRSDPRSLTKGAAVTAELWRRALLDQMVRRIMGGVRDWGPILSRSRAGQQDLVDLGRLRLDLLALNDLLADGVKEVDLAPFEALQRRARLLAWKFESESGASHQRLELVHPEVGA